MIPCSSCGYQFESEQLQQRTRGAFRGAYCRICLAIGGDKVNENPDAYGEAKVIVPQLAYCTNMLMAAIATRAEAGEMADVTPAHNGTGRPAFIVLSSDGQMVEVQDEKGKPVELSNARFSKVEGTEFKKFRVLIP